MRFDLRNRHSRDSLHVVLLALFWGALTVLLIIESAKRPASTHKAPDQVRHAQQAKFY